jgi:hypothetical protein
VTQPCIVLIASRDLLPGLQERTADSSAETLTFTDAEALRALEAVTTRRPTYVALERLFAVTPRGAALINRIKADASLRAVEIRVLSHDGDYMRIVPRQQPPAASPIDQRGTRRAARFAMVENTDVLVDGMVARLVNLSTVGAQVLSPALIKPDQRVSVTLRDEAVSVRCSASVAWTSFEIPPGAGPRYRAGLNFENADPASVDGFCERHRTAAPPSAPTSVTRATD